MSTPAMQAAIAAHRFGLGEAATEASVRGDARGWLLAQIGPADAQRNAAGEAMPEVSAGLRRMAEFQLLRRQRREPAPAMAMSDAAMQDARSGEQQFGEHSRAIVQAD